MRSTGIFPDGALAFGAGRICRIVPLLAAMLLAGFPGVRLHAQDAAGGQPVLHLTLARAIELAIQHDRRLKLARLAVAQSRESQNIARSLYYPHISSQSNAVYLTDLQGVVLPAGALAASAGTGLIPGQTIRIGQGSQESFTSGTGIVQPLTQLIRVHAGARAAAADVKTAEATEKDAENSTALLVCKLYFGILTAQAQLEATKTAADAAKTKDQESRRAIVEGRALDVASLETRAALLDRQQAVLRTRLSIDDLILQMDDVIGQALGTKLDLDSRVLADAPQLPSRADALAMVRDRSPRVQEARQMVEKARAGLAAAHAAYLPDISGLARYSYQSGVPFLVHNFGTFGGNVSFDLFDGGAREAKLRQAKVQLEIAQTQLQQAASDTSVAVAAAYHQIDELRMMADAAAAALEARTEAARVIQERTQQDAAMPSEGATALAAVAESQASLLQVQLELLLRERDVLQMLGERP